MLLSSFLPHYLAVKANDADASILKAIVSMDPNGAAKADLAVMDANLNRIGGSLVSLRAQVAANEKAFAPLMKDFNIRLTAAEDLQSQVDAAQGDARAKLQTALEGLLAGIERDRGQIEDAQKNLAADQEWLQEREQAFAEAKTRLATAKSRLDGAKRDLARATEQADRERQRTAQVRSEAGMSGGGKLDIALNAMQQATESQRQAGEKAKLMRSAYAKPASAPVDPLVAAAIARASGTDEAPKSTADRIAALRKVPQQKAA